MTIRPGNTGETWYPTGAQWLSAYALAGCKWAIDALEKYKREYTLNQYYGIGI